MKAKRDHDYSSVIGSFAVHALLFLAIYFVFNREHESGGRPGTETIQFETLNEKKSEKQHHEIHTKSEVGHRSKTVQASHAIALSDLGLKLNTERLSSPTAQSEENNTDSNEVTDDGWDLRNPDPRIARFNQYIYNTVQGWLDRDNSEEAQRIYGTVKVRIWFDENGEYLEAETVYEAMDPNFQRVVARALRKSFTNPVPRPFLFMHRKFSIERMVVIRGYS